MSTLQLLFQQEVFLLVRSPAAAELLQEQINLIVHSDQSVLIPRFFLREISQTTAKKITTTTKKYSSESSYFGGSNLRGDVHNIHMYLGYQMKCSDQYRSIPSYREVNP